MMRRQNGQMCILVIDMDSMIPSKHLLKRIDKIINFGFIYDIVAPYYPSQGRPSVEPVSMFKCCWWDIGMG